MGDEPVEYTGPIGAMRDSNWLTWEDIKPTGDTIVTIEKVILRRGYQFRGSKSAKDTFSLKFKGKNRELRVAACHRKVLCDLTGVKGNAAVTAWKGLTIALFVMQDVGRPDGTIQPAIRIRAKRIQPPKDAPGSTQATPTYQDTTQDEIVDPGASQDDSGNTGSDR